MHPTLVILAAGLGRRFGGDKQLEGVGPGGHPMLAYALHDAARAGFARAVIVVRDGLEPLLRRKIAPELPVEYVIQASGRARPWGTGHAVLAAAPLVATPFMVVNADDFYGADTYRIMAEFLATEQDPSIPTFAVAGFPLGDTLSEEGPVNRGICRVGEDGWLAEIREVTGLVPGDEAWPPRTPVSLNAWGFTPAVFPLLSAGFSAFEREAGAEDEFLLPESINQQLERGLVRVRVLEASGPWIGVTWPADVPRATEHLARILVAGEYQSLR